MHTRPTYQSFDSILARLFDLAQEQGYALDERTVRLLQEVMETPSVTFSKALEDFYQDFEDSPLEEHDLRSLRSMESGRSDSLDA